MAKVLQITIEQLQKILNWPDMMTAMQIAMLNVTERRAVQTPRSFTQIPKTQNMLLTMPGYLNAEEFSVLACKVVTTFPENTLAGTPAVLANILLFNEKTGALDAILDGTDVTLWRTAGASLVASKFIRSSKSKNDVLALIGTGAQGRIHGIAFQEIFKFKKVHVWNRTQSKAVQFCDEQNAKGMSYIHFTKIDECVANADVIITSTSSTSPLIKREWLKKGVHINAVGFAPNIMELDEETYKASTSFVDHFDGVKNELQHMTDLGIQFKAEVGALINGTVLPPPCPDITIFQSLGMAAQDCAVAKILYEKYRKMDRI